jgi:hypothetical protein
MSEKTEIKLKIEKIFQDIKLEDVLRPLVEEYWKYGPNLGMIKLNMITQDTQAQEYEYELRDIANYSSTDPKGLVPGSESCYLTEKVASELNYARALNGNPHRLIKVED